MTASIVRVGDQQRVTADTPYYEQSSSVIVLKDGGWLVTWTSFDQGLPSIHRQRYDKVGVAVEAPTRLDIGTPDPNYQSVAALADGGWVVTWSSEVTQDVHQQRYDETGAAIGPETVVNTYTTYIQTAPSVTALPERDGGWVVTWVSVDQDGSYGGIYQQRYDKNGGAVGPETQVNTYTANYQNQPAVTALKDGGWVVTWTSVDGTEPYTSREVYQQRYDKDGIAVGPETTVNTTQSGSQWYPSVTALADGGWVVIWESLGRRGIYQQRYDKTGAAVGPETWISPPSFDEAKVPSVTALADGGWLITWAFVEGAYIDAEIHQQRYGADGHPVGGAQQVNIEGPDMQTGQKVTALPDGSWLVTWASSSPEGNSSEIYQRRFTSVAAFGEGREMGTGTAGDDLFQVSTGGLTAGDSIDGGEGNDTLAMVEAGTLDLTAPDVFTSIETVQGSGGNDIIVADGNRLSGIAQVHGGDGTDALHLKSGSYDLSDMAFSGMEAITLLGTGSLTFDDKATALLARSQSQNGTVTLTGASFTVTERTQLYSQGIREVTDASGLHVLQQAQASLSKQAVTENAGNGTVIGTLSATDPNPGDGLRFELLDSAGGRFALSGNQLVVANDAGLDYESGASHRIVVRIIDEGGINTDAAFTITLDNIPVETIKGTARADRLTGGTGMDVLWGGLGKDTLTGDKGQDIFVFDTKPNKKSNLDKIADFSVKDDTIWLDNKVFTKLGKAGTEAKPAPLKKDFFVTGSKAKDKNDYVIYDKAKGVLFYDADGSGTKHAAVEIATLPKKLAMTYKDFFVI